jgi:hypothetical protein
MIVNHKYKFIFVKTRKTAGTSIEIALSQLSGDDDIITPISPEDEMKRQEAGARKPQNYKVPLRYYGLSDWFRLLRSRQPKYYKNHAPAWYIRDHIDRDIWNTYFKFCFERNPFDKAISRYYWSTRNVTPRPEIGEYLASAPIELLSNWDIYTIDDKIAVDFVGRYESLHEDLAKVAEKLGLPGGINLPNAKGGHRKDNRHYSEVLDARARARLEQVCAKEIAAFSYHYSTVAPSSAV